MPCSRANRSDSSTSASSASSASTAATSVGTRPNTVSKAQARRREGPARPLEVVRRQHDDAVVAVVARDQEGAGDQVGGKEMMRHGEPAHRARRDSQRLGRGDRLDEDRGRRRRARGSPARRRSAARGRRGPRGEQEEFHPPGFRASRRRLARAHPRPRPGAGYGTRSSRGRGRRTARRLAGAPSEWREVRRPACGVSASRASLSAAVHHRSWSIIASADCCTGAKFAGSTGAVVLHQRRHEVPHDVDALAHRRHLQLDRDVRMCSTARAPPVEP